MTSDKAPADLRNDTEVLRVRKIPGLFSADLSDRWNYFNPCGGVLMTIALRAMEQELDDPNLTLLSATTLFCQAVLAGPMSIAVTVLRRGETAAQVKATLSSAALPGSGLEVLATFTKSLDGPNVHGVSMPDVDAPDPAKRINGRGTPFPIFDNIEIIPALGDPMWSDDGSPAPAHVAYWYRYVVPQQRDGAFDPLAIPPLADSMPPALVRRLGKGAPRYLMPSLDLTVYFLENAKSEWLLVESFVERAREGYAIGSVNLWSEDGVLCARGAQSMTLRPRKW